MKLLILTPTLGTNPLLRETVASVGVAAGAGARHVLIAPATRQAAVIPLVPGGEFVRDAGAGIYAALNRGARAAAQSGAWDAVTWINDDDRLVAEGFRAAVETLRTQPAIGVAYGRVGLIDGEGAKVGALPVARRGDDLPALLARGIVALAQPGTVIRRAVWEQLDGMDESYRLAGDLDFFARALAAGVKFGFVDAEVAEFRLRAGQLSKRAEEGEREKLRALAPLAGVPASALALGRFRLGNLGVYADRVRRHGFVSMRAVYDRTN